MPPLALALHLALAVPGAAPPAIPALAPALDPGPFGGGELLAASLGVFAGDLAVVGAGYGALQLFANGTISPTAANFRDAAYVLGVTALVLPPLTAVLLARLTGRRAVAGSVWKALLLATAGHALALGAGLLAAPQFWVTLPAQLLAVAVGTSVGLHWGPRGVDPRTRVPAPGPAVRGAAPDGPDAPREPAAALGWMPICPDA